MSAVDYLIRAETREAWLAYAQDQGWLAEDGLPVENVYVDEIGPVVVTPGDPPVMDTWHHVNLRLFEQDDGLKSFASARNVVTEQDVRAIEGDTEEGAIQVLYPEDISTLIRIWANGMNPGPLTPPQD